MTAQEFFNKRYGVSTTTTTLDEQTAVEFAELYAAHRCDELTSWLACMVSIAEKSPQWTALDTLAEAKKALRS